MSFNHTVKVATLMVQDPTDHTTIILFSVYSSSRSIEDLLKKWGLRGVEIPLEEFNANEVNIGGSNLSDSHTIQMLEITCQQAVQDAPK